jgi:hypothetical protein
VKFAAYFGISDDVLYFGQSRLDHGQIKRSAPFLLALQCNAA